jgi:hypothetical protein
MTMCSEDGEMMGLMRIVAVDQGTGGSERFINREPLELIAGNGGAGANENLGPLGRVVPFPTDRHPINE